MSDTPLLDAACAFCMVVEETCGTHPRLFVLPRRAYEAILAEMHESRIFESGPESVTYATMFGAIKFSVCD